MIDGYAKWCWPSFFSSFLTAVWGILLSNVCTYVLYGGGRSARGYLVGIVGIEKKLASLAVVVGPSGVYAYVFTPVTQQ